MTVNVQLQYEPFETIVRRVEAMREHVDIHRQRIQHILDLMDAGAWIGQGSEAFIHELLTVVHPSVERLATALEATAVTLRAAMQRIQDADQQGAALFKNGADSGGETQHGYAVAKSVEGRLYDDLPTYDGQLTGDKDAKILFINGVGMSDKDHLKGLTGVSEMYHGAKVAGIYNQSDPTWGKAGDFFQSVNDWSESWTGKRLGSNPAVDATMDWVRNNPDGQLVVYSQGGAITSAALMNLRHDGFDLSKLKVRVIGGAGPIFPHDPAYEFFETTSDPVPKVTRFLNAPLQLIFTKPIGTQMIEHQFDILHPGAGHDLDLYMGKIIERENPRSGGGGGGGYSGSW